MMPLLCISALADEGACAPDSPPRLIKAAAPQLLDLDVRWDYATVELTILLDANSTVTDVVVYKSTLPVLNSSAIAAARASTFKTAIRDCKPIATTYKFVIIYRGQ